MHKADESVLPEGPVAAGTALPLSVHDRANVSGAIGGVTLGGTVSFRFYPTGGCPAGDAFTGGTLINDANVSVVAGVAHPSAAQSITGAGSYAFKARYNGDANYDASVSACENFTVTTIKLNKVTASGPGGPFGFTIAGPTPSTPSLTTVGTPGTATTGVMVVGAGAYSMTESSIPANWVFTGSTCSNTPPPDGDPITGTPSGSPLGITWSYTVPAGTHWECTFDNTPVVTGTRTQGYWSTHLELARIVWFGGTWGSRTYPGIDPNAAQQPADGDLDATSYLICGNRDIDDLPELMGGFWSGISRKTSPNGPDGARVDIDRARMQLMQQLLAAILNNAAFGSSPTGGVSIAQAKAAFCSTDIGVVRNAAGKMAEFNEAGDGAPVSPGAAAEPRLAKDTANELVWDVLPGS